MKALSVIQPNATLIVEALRLIEYRSWSIEYRGWLAIHASGTVNSDMRAAFHYELIFESLTRRGYRKFEDLPRGCFVSVVNVIDCIDAGPSQQEYIWRFGEFVKLAEPIPARGLQNLWTPTAAHTQVLQNAVSGRSNGKKASQTATGAFPKR